MAKQYPVQRLMAAAQSGRLKQIIEAVEDGFPLEKKRGKHVTLLVEAIEFNQSKVALWLLSKGANPTAKRSPKAWSLLHWAAFNKTLNIVEKLIEAGADPNDVENKDKTSVLHVARTGEIITHLANHGANLNPVDRRGYSPFVHFEKSEQYIALREAGAEWADDCTPDIVMRCGSDVLFEVLNTTDYPCTESTFNEIAGWPGTHQTVQLLLDRGVRPSTDTIDRLIQGQRFEDIEALVKAGVEIELPKKCPNRIRAIVEGTESPELDPREEFNRLFEQGDYERAASLVDKLDDLDKRVKTNSHGDAIPLLCSAAMIPGAFPVVKRLLECGADPNVKTQKSWYGQQSPLHFAARLEDFKTLELLVEYGGDLRQQTSDGVAPWQYADTSKILKRFPELKKDYKKMF